MNIGADNLIHSMEWEKLYCRLAPEIKSPFFAAAFYASYAQIEQADFQCFWGYKDEKNFLFYPYLSKSINSLAYDLPTDYHDISGAYGYNGPIRQS